MDAIQKNLQKEQKIKEQLVRKREEDEEIIKKLK